MIQNRQDESHFIEVYRYSLTYKGTLAGENHENPEPPVDLHQVVG